MTRGLKFGILEVEKLYFICSEDKGTDQLRGVTAQLICDFAFAYEKSKLSHDGAHILCFRNLVLDGNVADEQNWYELITEESP